jgi:hypothetical protein
LNHHVTDNETIDSWRLAPQGIRPPILTTPANG